LIKIRIEQVTLHKDQCTFIIISTLIFLRTRNFPDKNYSENQNTQIMFNKFFSEKSCLLWDNLE